MKELSIEEKAKRYEEVSKEVKDFFEGRQKMYSDVSQTLEYLFPELRESEDERIRKELLAVIDDLILADEQKERFVAWLEKQGNDIKKIKELENKIESLQKCFKIANDEIADKSQELYALKYRIEDDLELKKIKQKPAEEYNITGIKSKNAQGKLGEMIKNLKPVKEVLEQKPVNKIEPKFKVSDWVVNKLGDSWHIDSFDKKNYQVSDGKGNYNYFPILKQDEMHLWTIQDAKDGDVLACNSDILSICIFAHFDGINNKYDSFLCYCGLEGEGLGQELNINGYHDDSTGYVPATKEQRDLLFQKMNEAGYKWDEKNKKLNKIEQKQIIDYSDSLPKDNWELIHEFVNKFGRIPKDEDELNVLIKYILKRQKPWSEEDERIYQSIMDDTVQENQLDDKQINWLRNIKYWIFAQPQNTWKPTEKQLISLSCAIAALDAEDDDLASLYEILKKL